MKICTMLLIPGLLFMMPAYAQTITKCQDENGKWHYGDYAAEACARESTVTEINQRGLKVDESEAPPTREELEARKAEEQEKKQEAERRAARKRENERLLRTYDSEDSIITARDERVEALENELASHELFRQDLVDEKNKVANSAEQEGKDERLQAIEQEIEQYDKAIRTLKQDRQEVLDKYNRELEAYRELTSG